MKRGRPGETTTSRLESVVRTVVPAPFEAEAVPLIVASPDLLLEERSMGL